MTYEIHSVNEIKAVEVDPALAMAVTVAVQKWKYKPKLINANPVVQT